MCSCHFIFLWIKTATPEDTQSNFIEPRGQGDVSCSNKHIRSFFYNYIWLFSNKQELLLHIQIWLLLPTEVWDIIH